MYRVARNLALNAQRKGQRGEKAALAHPDRERTAPPADHALEEEELARALAQAVKRLPPALAELFHLRSSGMSYEEMASVLEIPLGTIKSRMHQMVAQLREDLGPWTAR
jgi:RNA polymerase sigma-70 factor (ECF subfamily)